MGEMEICGLALCLSVCPDSRWPLVLGHEVRETATDRRWASQALSRTRDETATGEALEREFESIS